MKQSMISSVNQKTPFNFKGKMWKKKCFLDFIIIFFIYFCWGLLDTQKHYLKQPEHNLGVKLVFLPSLQASVITDFFPAVTKTVELKYFRIFKILPIYCSGNTRKNTMHAKEMKITYYQRICFHVVHSLFCQSIFVRYWYSSLQVGYDLPYL